MKYLKTFESFINTPIPKAVHIEQEDTLIDKHIDKEISEEEIEELEKSEKEVEERQKVKKKVA